MTNSQCERILRTALGAEVIGIGPYFGNSFGRLVAFMGLVPMAHRQAYSVG